MSNFIHNNSTGQHNIRLWVIIMAVIIGCCFCFCLFLAAGSFFLFSRTSDEQISSNSATFNEDASLFTYDFSNPDDHDTWTIVASSDYKLEITRDKSYQITINKPNWKAYSIPKTPLKQPFRNVDLSFRARLQKSGTGTFGAFCNWQDENNYYRIDLTNTQFAIGKVIDGKFTQLTEPYWQEFKDAQAGKDGYLPVSIVCSDNNIIVKINGNEQGLVSDSDLDSGDVAIFGKSFEQKDSKGVYAVILFKDFSLSINQE